MSLLHWNRRHMLQSLAALPGLAALMPASLAAAAPRLGRRNRDVIAELGLTKFINAAGTYTSLTASLIPRPAFEAWTWPPVRTANCKTCTTPSENVSPR